jgi:hypothetical protein
LLEALFHQSRLNSRIQEKAMHGIVKTVGTSVFGTIAIPVAGISGLGAIGSLLAWIFSAQNRTGDMFLFFVAASTTCLLAIRFPRRTT